MSPPVSTSPAALQPPFFAGIDVGGTNIKIGIVDDNGQMVARTSVPTFVTEGPDTALRRAAIACRRLASSVEVPFEQLAAIGLGAPGTMDIPAGMLLEPPNLPGWWNFPLRDRLIDLTERPVVFANDANAAAFGEYWVGSGRDYPSIVLFTLGTGVGGGIIVHGKSINGENSHGSECGHVIIDYHETARMCGCGQRGHLEAYASATALVKRAEEALAAGRISSLSLHTADAEAFTPLLIAREAEAGDALSHELIMDTARYLGIGATSLIHAIDPGAVIFGGAMNFGGHQTALGRQFLERIRTEVKARAFPVPASRVVIDFASLGSDAGFIGAAGIAREELARSKPQV